MILSILKLRKDLHELYKKHNRIATLLVKGIGALVLFLSLNSLYNSTDKMMLGIAVGLAVVCMVLPAKYIYAASALITAIHLWQISWDLAVVFAVIVFISWVFVCRVLPDAGLIIAATPFLFVIKIPFLMPLLVGMFSNVFGIAAMVFGVVFYFLGVYSSNISALLSSPAAEDYILAMQAIMAAFGADKELLLILVACVIAAVVTYILCHQSFDYSWYIGCVSGGIAGLVTYFAGSIIFEVAISHMVFIWTIPLAMCIACLFQFLRCIIDYSGVEYVEFEDDDYYYYVKAVPKVNVIVEDFALLDDIKTRMTQKVELEKIEQDKAEEELVEKAEAAQQVEEELVTTEAEKTDIEKEETEEGNEQ